MKKEEPARMLDALTQKDIIFQFGRRIRIARFLNPHCLKICFSLIVIQVFLTHPVTTHAQSETPSASSMTESSLTENRSAFREPSFLKKGSGLRWQGVFFGVGFRHLHLSLGNGTEVVSNQPDQNGIGFMIGLLQEEYAYEYERQVSIIDSGKTISFEQHSGTRIESIQNTFSFSWYPRLMRDLHGQLGVGLQGSRTVLSGKDSSAGIRSETAIQLSGGAAYFATQNLMLHLRISRSWDLALIRSGNRPMLETSLIRALFLNYYYPL